MAPQVVRNDGKIKKSRKEMDKKKRRKNMKKQQCK
jgi:hypothetical protein